MNLMFWKKPKRMQPCLITTEDGRVVDTSLPVELGYLIDRKADEAYILAPATMVPYCGLMYAVLDERDGLPPAINEAARKAREHYKKSINLIGHENWRQGFYSSAVEVKSFLVQQYMAVMAVGIGVVLTVLFLVTYLLSGKLHIGG